MVNVFGNCMVVVHCHPEQGEESHSPYHAAHYRKESEILPSHSPTGRVTQNDTPRIQIICMSTGKI
jgi:hypothetical protein